MSGPHPVRRLSVAAVIIMLLSLLVVPQTRAEPIGDYFFERTWERTDRPVAELRVSRTWMWGPEPFTDAFYEQYVDASLGERRVQYFDKSRMEINNSASSDSIWYVTNGLLAKELITGQAQLGDDVFEPYFPANVNVAGDPNDPNAPTYQSFSALMGYAALPAGWVIMQTVDRAGAVGTDESLGSYGVTTVDVGAPTQHTVASVFWDFMNSVGLVYDGYAYETAPLFENPFYATGYPLTEAYWAHVLVGGQDRLVLTQVFERRVLTYTPDNPDGWKVEAGNVGRHYYQWRYHDIPGSRENPVPIGQERPVSEGWRLAVLSVTPNANAIVAEENQFNDPPEPGKQFFMARVSATYTGPGSSTVASLTPAAIGPANVAYTTYGNSCGVIPDRLSYAEVYTGGTVTGNVCWEIPSGEAGGMVMYDQHQPEPRTFFALHQ